jgi:hypothetical protein
VAPTTGSVHRSTADLFANLISGIADTNEKPEYRGVSFDWKPSEHVAGAIGIGGRVSGVKSGWN